MIGPILPLGENTDPPEENDDARLNDMLALRQKLLDDLFSVEWILENEFGRVF